MWLRSDGTDQRHLADVVLHGRQRWHCVEIGNANRAVIVRDTKNRKGVVLTFGPKAFREFVASVKQDH
jgi:hypothetical protein